jgi:hypothetical protein
MQKKLFKIRRGSNPAAGRVVGRWGSVCVVVQSIVVKSIVVKPIVVKTMVVGKRVVKMTVVKSVVVKPRVVQLWFNSVTIVVSNGHFFCCHCCYNYHNYLTVLHLKR